MAGRSIGVRTEPSLLDPDQNVKTILEQAVGVGAGDGLNMPSVGCQEVWIVPLFREQLLAIVAAVVDVIVGAWP